MYKYQDKYALKIFKALANANRIKILRLLAKNKNGRFTVGEICEKLNLGQGNTSSHLVRLRNDGILRAKQKGTNMYYSLKDENAIKILGMIE